VAPISAVLRAADQILTSLRRPSRGAYSKASLPSTRSEAVALIAGGIEYRIPFSSRALPVWVYSSAPLR
jgi:hypothetical protein